MKKIRLTVNVDNYFNKVPQKIKHDLHDIFGGLENLFEEAIATISNSMIRDVFNLQRTKELLHNHAYETINAVTQEEEVSADFVSIAADGFYQLCFDLHDAVIPNAVEPDLELSDIHIKVDEVETFGHYHGEVSDEVDLYLTCSVIGEDEAPRPKLDTMFQVDDEQLYDWAPYKLHPFVRGVMVDVILQFLKYGMKHPSNMTSASNISVYHIVWTSIKTQLTILEEEINSMDNHNFNPDVVDMWNCYDDHLYGKQEEMNKLVDKIASFATDFFYSPSKMKDEIWSRLINFKNAYVFRDKNMVTFRLLPH